MPTIGPKEQRHFDITYTFLADKSAVDGALQQVRKIQDNRPTEVRKSPLVELPKDPAFVIGREKCFITVEAGQALFEELLEREGCGEPDPGPSSASPRPHSAIVVTAGLFDGVSCLLKLEFKH